MNWYDSGVGGNLFGLILRSASHIRSMKPPADTPTRCLCAFTWKGEEWIAAYDAADHRATMMPRIEFARKIEALKAARAVPEVGHDESVSVSCPAH